MVGLFGLLFTTLTVSSLVSAGEKPDWSQGRAENFDPIRHEAMQEAFNNNDYDAWLELMGDRGVTRFITAENFDQFAEVHNLIQDGQFEKAKALREELGLQGMHKRMHGQKGTFKHGFHKGYHKGVEGCPFNE